NQPVDITLRATGANEIILIRLRCGASSSGLESEGDIFPGNISTFGVRSGTNSVMGDLIKAGSGLQSFRWSVLQTRRST
ncbi:MAG: hypothetical protein M3Q33_13415, partial [Acidobacteriota bacterium]|nr:hypothetical protein [Acidobacteriota bacterium]